MAEGKSIAEVAASSPPLESTDEKRIRELATKAGTLTPPEVAEAVKLLLGVELRQLKRARRPRP